MNFARAACFVVLASLLLAGVVLATAGATWVGLGLLSGGGLVFGLVVPLGSHDGGYRVLRRRPPLGMRLFFAGVAIAAVLLVGCGSEDEASDTDELEGRIAALEAAIAELTALAERGVDGGPAVAEPANAEGVGDAVTQGEELLSRLDDIEGILGQLETIDAALGSLVTRVTALENGVAGSGPDETPIVVATETLRNIVFPNTLGGTSFDTCVSYVVRDVVVEACQTTYGVADPAPANLDQDTVDELKSNNDLIRTCFKMIVIGAELPECWDLDYASKITIIR